MCAVQGRKVLQPCMSKVHWKAQHKQQLRSCINNLATLLQDRAKIVEVEPLSLDALSVRRATFGDEHTYAGISISYVVANGMEPQLLSWRSMNKDMLPHLSTRSVLASGATT